MLYLLDSSAVLNDFSFSFSPEHSYLTTPPIINEFKDMRSKNLVENALQQDILQIQEPSEQSLQQIKETVTSKGFAGLGEADLSLLALAIDLKNNKQEFTLVTDDYSIQNFCELLEIPAEAVIRGKIKETISFSLKCPACGKVMEATEKTRNCPVCGSPIKRVRNEESAQNSEQQE